MILSRVIEHVKAQNWTAVGLDFLIVVMGVFIGIQVSNWNAAQKDNARAVGYLERIRDDLDADVNSYRRRLEFWNEVSAHGRRMLALGATESPDESSDWGRLISFFQASQIDDINTTDATYEELKSAGELGLISDPELRDRLAYYYVNTSYSPIEQQPAYREHVREIIPIEMQLYIWDNCYQSTATGEQELLECPPPSGGADVSDVVRRIANDSKLMGELTFWVSSLRVTTLTATNRMESALALRSEIDSQLSAQSRAGKS